LGEKIGVNVLPSAFMTDLQEEGIIETQQEIELYIESDAEIAPSDDKV
jgi:DNA-binding transcriptional regulator YhcF (GntR family)